MPTHSGYCTPDQVIADAVSMYDDEGFKELSPGWCMGKVQEALAELAFDTYFNDMVAVLPVTENLILNLPEGLFVIDNVYAFNGNECTTSNQNTVWYARNYVRYGGGMFKEQRGENYNNPIMEDVMTASDVSATLFYGTLDNRMFLSDACAAYEKIMIKYRGMGCKLGDAPFVPNEFRTAVSTYIALQALTILNARYKGVWSGQLQFIHKKHYGGNGAFDVGTWKQAQRRAQSVSPKQRNDLKKYLSRLAYNIE